MQAATQDDLNFPRTTVTFGSLAFAVSGPTCWNSLPSSLKSSLLQPEQFRIQLKTTLIRLLQDVLDKSVTLTLTLSKVYHCWIFGLARKPDSEISHILPLILTGIKKSEIWPRFSTLIAFEVLLCFEMEQCIKI